MRVQDIFEADPAQITKLVQKIASDNKITNPNLIQVGQNLRLPDGSNYTTVAGDSLWKIASRITGATSQPSPQPTLRPGPNVNIDPAIRQQAQTHVDAQAIVDIVKTGPGFIDVKTADGKLLRRTGNANWRMNNPGNLRPSPWTKQQPGYVGVGDAGPSGQFAVFATLEDGIAAKKKLLFDPRSKYYNLSIADAITRYAPPSDNNATSSYIQTVVQATQASPQTPLSKLSSAQQDRMLTAINRVEGFKVGQVKPLQQEPLTADIHQDTNPEDTVELDIPLLLRMLEFAREDADTDMDLHDVTDKMIELSQQGETLNMDDYQSIISKDVEERFNLPKHLFTRRDRFKSLKREAVGGSAAEKLIKDIEYEPEKDDEDEVREGYGRYWCSTDKRWKDRKGPKQSRS